MTGHYLAGVPSSERDHDRVSALATALARAVDRALSFADAESFGEAFRQTVLEARELRARLWAETGDDDTWLADEVRAIRDESGNILDRLETWLDAEGPVHASR